jgi:hypothetical protein
MKVTISGFQGANKALHPKLLPESVGVESLNQKPGRGDLRPWKTPLTVATIPPSAKAIYRMGRDVASDTMYWLSWNKDVHVSQGFETEDLTERTYYTGDGVPKVTDTTMALATTPYPMTSRLLGVPQPQTKLLTTVNSISVPAASADAQMETVFYVYTYVTDWGSEGMPSPVSAQVDKKRADHVTLSGFSAPQAGNYGVETMRVYRTQANSGGADFYFMKEVPLGTQTVVDDGSDLGEVMATANWAMPPENLKFLTSMWNGMLAGISGNSVRFCEAYVPYAWPTEYDAIPPDGTPVGLGVFGQTLLVLTTGRPMVLSGSSPEAMDQQPLEIPQSCVSARSIVGMGAGVAWASNDGLCWYGAGGARVLTAGIMTREDWQALSPSSIVGCMYEGLYFGSYDNGAGRKGFMVDPSSTQGIYFLDVGYEAMHFDELQDQLYIASGTSVQRWDAGVPMTATFKSKVFKAPYPTNFSCAELVADSLPVTVRVFADGAMVHEQALTERGPFRLPSGFMAYDWQVEIVTSGAVQGLVLANNMSELREV